MTSASTKLTIKTLVTKMRTSQAQSNLTTLIKHRWQVIRKRIFYRPILRRLLKHKRRWRKDVHESQHLTQTGKWESRRCNATKNQTRLDNIVRNPWKFSVRISKICKNDLIKKLIHAMLIINNNPSIKNWVARFNAPVKTSKASALKLLV